MKLISKAKKTSHKQTSLLGGRKYTLVFDTLAAMVTAQTSVQQQHINPSWPSILTCDKRGGREGGGAPLSTAPHFRVPGHQQALESPRSLGALYSCRGREKERRGKRRGGRGALSLEDNVWSRLETCGHWDEERVEREAVLSYRSTKKASCFWVFVCLSF